MAAPGAPLVEDVTEETLIFELGEDSDGKARLGRVNRDVVRVVWEAFSTFVEKQIEMNKAVNIPNFGKFTFLVEKGGPNGTKFKEPVFVWNDAFLKQNGLKARSIPRGTLLPTATDLNLSMVAMLASESKDVVSNVIKQFTASMARILRESTSNAKLRIRIRVMNVGRICCQQGMCKFAYDAKYGCTRPGTNETCRTSASRRSSLASRSSVLGGSEGPISSSRELNAAMKGAVGGAAKPKPREGYGNSELMTIEEMRQGEPMEAGDESGPEEQEADAGQATGGSAMIESIMDGDQWKGDEFDANAVENLLEQSGGIASQHPYDAEAEDQRSSYSGSVGSSVTSRTSAVSDVLPVYLCPEMTRSSRRIQRQKQIVASALQDAYSRYDQTLEKELDTVSRENQLFEAELRRQTQAANELRMWRRSNLLEQRKTHEEQMTAAHEQEKTANANMREPMPGYINSRKFVDDGRQKILEPHQQMLHKTLHSQVESRKVRQEEEKAEVVEYEQLQNELLMKDMELRQSYVKESMMNEGATLRSAWERQLNMKRKTDVLHKVNDDVITNVGGDVLQGL